MTSPAPPKSLSQHAALASPGDLVCVAGGGAEQEEEAGGGGSGRSSSASGPGRASPRLNPEDCSPEDESVLSRAENQITHYRAPLKRYGCGHLLQNCSWCGSSHQHLRPVTAMRNHPDQPNLPHRIVVRIKWRGGTMHTIFSFLEERPPQGVAEIEKLKDTFARTIFFLEEKSMAKVPYSLAVKEAVEQVEKEVAQLKAGFQIEAHQYKCSSCSTVDCQLPIDCPIQDVHKLQGDVTLLNCEVKFRLPSDPTFRWKFAKDTRTKKLFLFKDLSFGFNPSLLIRPTLESHRGTFFCQIAEEDEVLVRKFFYLNVTEKRLALEKELQEMFKAILHPPPKLELEDAMGKEEVQTSLPSLPEMPSLQEMFYAPDSLSKKNVIFLIVGIAMSSMLVTLAAMTIYQWATDIKL
ncbi:sperm acrosome membrane-associated protein 6 [Rhineura floridana]|uniref:sperm acrosome membrane-associated protein 6 n=1 Tax=Rhineura floridana TaxID=261503 RepID=UPI002AC83C2F|nr:sperm acrosome membrane-associated protein 6 [Rhineura floridana]